MAWTDAAVALALLVAAAPTLFYPLLLCLRARLAPVPVAARDWTPDVDLVICAHDEESSVAAKLENALGLDYPPERLHVVLASDGSGDRTVERARAFAARGVRVLDLPRVGKARALEAAVAQGESEILAFSDANSMWESGALRALVRPLADPSVGGVAGDQRYARSGGAVGERGYWSYDRQLKRWQSEAGSVVSATGAIYAIRRAHFAPPPPDATDDFMVSTGVIAAGRRLVFAGDAVAVEPPARGHGGEFRRRVRIITRGLRAVGYRRSLLWPGRSGLYGLELLLHKLWRRLVWVPLLALAALAPWAWPAGGPAAWISAGALAGLAVGALGAGVPALGRLPGVSLATYGVAMNAACALATWNALRGHRVSRWDTARPADGGVAS